MTLKHLMVLVLAAVFAVSACKKKEGEAQPPAAENPPAETPPAETPPAETPPAETPPAETPPAETPPAETPPAETPPAETPPAAGGGDCQAYIDRMIACAKEMAGPAWTAEMEAQAKTGAETGCQGWNATPQGAKILEAIAGCTQTNCVEWMTCTGQAATAAMGVEVPAAPPMP